MPSSGVQTCARSEEHTSELQHGSISYAVSLDRKSTRLNSSHGSISYAVFCLKKKNKRMKSSQRSISYAFFCSTKYKSHLLPRRVCFVISVRPPISSRFSFFFFFFFFLMIRRPPRSPLFPSPALFR